MYAARRNLVDVRGGKEVGGTPTDRVGNSAATSNVKATMRSCAVLVVFAGLVAASCGSADDPQFASEPAPSATPRPTDGEIDSTTLPPAVPVATTSGEVDTAAIEGGVDCDPDLNAFVDAQFAFVGTVTDVRGEILPWDIDPENPDRPDDPEPTRWATFDVDGWYTVDWGTEFNVWMPTHRATVGDRIAVGGDARFVSIDGFSGQSGEVEFCTPAPEPVGESLIAWNEFFGPAIQAGAAVPEGDPDPADLEAIDHAEAAWTSVAGDSYSYLFSMYDRNQVRPECSSSTRRIVVVDDEIIEAVSTDSPRGDCDQSRDDEPSVAELFDLARQVAGATDFDFRSDLDNGTVMNFYTSDRSIETQVHVQRFSNSTAPTIVGWPAVDEAARSAADLWADASGDRVTTIQIGGGERAHYDLTTTETAGEVVEVRNGNDTIDPTALQQPWTPYTVDGVFELINELSGQGNVAAVFDQQTGAPTDLFFDPMPEAIDDELSLQITVTDPGATTDSRPSGSEAEQALREAGADLSQFPGDLDRVGLAEFCGVATITFDSDSSASTKAIDCLSETADRAAVAAAVFTMFTDEGDPIVSLWLVDSNRAEIFTDSSQDSFAGDPFNWNRLDCKVDLPLPGSVTQTADPYATFDC